MTDQQKNIGTRIVETKARSFKNWSIALGIVLVAALAGYYGIQAMASTSNGGLKASGTIEATTAHRPIAMMLEQFHVVAPDRLHVLDALAGRRGGNGRQRDARSGVGRGPGQRDTRGERSQHERG